nr:MAG TPA: hypothetical protein [Herelleviridae sp.]
MLRQTNSFMLFLPFFFIEGREFLFPLTRV